MVNNKTGSGKWVIAVLLALVAAARGAVYTLTVDPDPPDAPKTVGRYLVGANLVYSREDGRDWENGYKIEVLKRLGISNLRYPGGHVVSFWDWEWPYHDAYQNFWDPEYIATLDEARKDELFQENQHRLSLDQYLELCEETGAVPFIGINMLQGWKYDRTQDSVDKAVRLVNYVKDKVEGGVYYYLDNEVGHNPPDIVPRACPNGASFFIAPAPCF